MNNQNAPATKADIQEILKRVDERIDGLDASFTKKLDDFREETNRKLDDFREETNRKLGDISSQLQLLVEKTHFDLAEASHDAEEILKDHNKDLERRVRRLEKFAGFTAA